jgi:hypothetical protein
MDIKNKRILEALRMQPLSQEEMTARHILGRLYGPIATCVESTRNGRLYNKPLWEKALEDDIFLEKVATKALFLELGHPADREETDMKQACACIPEVPKIVGDDLYAYVDILDTPNGRLLKTLVDYGFIPGISSRGSGDVMDNNQVDPETFFLETWDIVQLPAVKKARLNVCESLDSNGIKLKKALAESYKAAKEEDKDTMKKALENLNIDIDKEIADPESEAEKLEEASNKRRLTAEDIPLDPDYEEDTLMEEMPAEESDDAEEENTEVEETSEAEETEEIEEVTDEETEEATSEEKIVDVNAAEETEIDTVGDAIEMLQEYDDDLRVEFEAVQADGKEYPINNITSFVDNEGEEEVLVLGVNCEETEETEEASEITDEDIVEESEEEISVEDSEEADDSSDSADDDGDVEVIESLKEMIRQKEALETEVSNLRKAKTVGDAKEQELQEKLTRYRTAFKNTSAEAAKVPELQAQIKKLNEQLTQSETKIKTLTEKVNNAQQLKESVDSSKAAVTRLNEQVTKLTKKSETLEAKLEGQTKVYTEKLQERTNLAKTYKARFIETLTKYVESKASMLGIQPSEITSRLNESYTLSDVDAVCDQILDSTVSFSRLPFGGRTKTSARIAESVSKPVSRGPEYGYEIDDDLLELAGLK